MSFYKLRLIKKSPNILDSNEMRKTAAYIVDLQQTNNLN